MRAHLCAPHPDDEADVRAGLEEAERGEGVRLTPQQVAQWARSGEFPWLESSSPHRSGRTRVDDDDSDR
jgi:hypothetical protein